jgi:hypothetical protein
MLVGSSDRDIDISGINFKGPGLSPADVHDESQTYYGGHGQHHAAMRFTSCTNIRVHDCSCELLLNDFVRTSRSSYIYVYNNVMNMHGHDGCQLYRTSNIQVYNNYIVVFINCGVRVAECTNATIYSNTFTSYSASGWNGVQIQGGSTGILVSKNVFTDMKDNYCCIGLQTSGSGCVIRDNIGYNVPGFLSNLGSATTSNNNIHKSKQDWAALGYGYSGKTTSIIVPTETVTVPKKQTTLVTPVTANKTTPVNNTVGIVMNTTIKPISNITEICEETQQIEKPDQCNESIAENVTLGTENITESYSENKTSDYLKPVIIAYEDCVVRVYKIPENVSPISYENGITVTASTT